jgi:hypothetical protein
MAYQFVSLGKLPRGPGGVLPAASRPRGDHLMASVGRHPFATLDGATGAPHSSTVACLGLEERLRACRLAAPTDPATPTEEAERGG